jgi:hypothetical protein
VYFYEVRPEVLMINSQLNSVEIVGLNLIFEKYVASSEMEVAGLGLYTEPFSIIKQNNRIEVLPDSSLFMIYFRSQITAKYTRKLCFSYFIIIASLIMWEQTVPCLLSSSWAIFLTAFSVPLPARVALHKPCKVIALLAHYIRYRHIHLLQNMKMARLRD